MLSKFESSKNDISAQKLFTALENTHTEVNEYLYLVRGFSESQLVKLQKKIPELEWNNDYLGLTNMYNSKIKKWEKAPSKQSHKINFLIIKAHMKELDEVTPFSKEEEAFLYEYPFNTELWGNYELTLFAISSTWISSELFTKYTRKMLHKTDFWGLLNENRTIIQTLLINGFLLCIEKEHFVNANYFDKYIQEHFFKEMVGIFIKESLKNSRSIVMKEAKPYILFFDTTDKRSFRKNEYQISQQLNHYIPTFLEKVK